MLISSLHYLRSFFKRALPRSNRGFTLIELIVVSAIIVVITAFMLFQQSKFNSATLLRSLTYSVALSMRQAQVYGTSVRESSLGSGVFGAGYGVYFPAGNTGQYYIFSDNNSNGVYDSGEELPQYALNPGYVIENICVTLSGSATQQCIKGTASLITSLTVYFRRPNPDACFATNTVPGACASAGLPATYSVAYVQLKSTGNGDTRSVRVSANGQISVCGVGVNVTTLPISC